MSQQSDKAPASLTPLAPEPEKKENDSEIEKD